MKPLKPTHAYVGRCPRCGSIDGVVSDMAGDKTWVGKRVAEMIRDGFNVERVAFGEYELRLDSCGCFMSVKDRIANRPTLLPTERPTLFEEVQP